MAIPCDAVYTPDMRILLADYFKVLSETSRLQILDCLRSGSMNVMELTEATGLGQANLSKHLKVLTHAGILSRRPQGNNAYYEVSDVLVFQLCQSVCNSISDRLAEQAKQFDQMERLTRSIR